MLQPQWQADRDAATLEPVAQILARGIRRLLAPKTAKRPSTAQPPTPRPN